MASIGVLPHEKQKPQPVIIDLEFSVDIAKAAANDDIQDTIDYVAVKVLIHDVVEQRHYQLLETLADTLLKALTAKFALTNLRLSISKPDIFADMEAVGIVITA